MTNSVTYFGAIPNFTYYIDVTNGQAVKTEVHVTPGGYRVLMTEIVTM